MIRKDAALAAQLVVLLSLSAAPLAAQDTPVAAESANTTSVDEESIRQNAQGYLEAFHEGDASAAASYWHAEGEFVTVDGSTFRGRQEIESSFQSYFEEFPGVKLEIRDPALSFLSPSVAVGSGIVIATYEDGDTTETEFEVIHVKRDGEWRFDRVAEANIARVPSHYDQLKELGWMIGQWVDHDDDSSFEVDAKWTVNGNFITMSFTVITGDQVRMQGTQIIGWDPVKKVIRSWVFDSDGGFGVGAWNREGDTWTVSTRHVLHDGSQASAINTYTYIDEDTYSFKSTGRSIDGQLMPNIEETMVYRTAR